MSYSSVKIGIVPQSRQLSCRVSTKSSDSKRIQSIIKSQAQPIQPALVKADGSKVILKAAAMLVGSATSVDIILDSAEVAAEHARIELKSGRLFCTALATTDPDDLFCPTRTWIDGTELRANVAYMVAPGATLHFGQQTADSSLTAEFSEGDSGGGAMAEMLMKGMASQASKEVQEKMQELE